MSGGYFLPFFYKTVQALGVRDLHVPQSQDMGGGVQNSFWENSG